MPYTIAPLISVTLLAVAHYSFAEEVISVGANYDYTSPSVPAQTPGIQPSQLGFFDVSSDLVPPMVKEAAQSVLFVATPAGKLTTVGSIFRNDHSIQVIIKRVEETPLSEELHEADKDIYLYQLRKCATTAKPMRCRMYEGDKLSSGYLVGDGSRLRTAFHAVSDLAHGNLQITGGMAKASVPIFIYDYSGRLVYSPTTDSAIAVFPKSNLKNGSHETGRITLPNEDLVEIQLNRSLGKPLRSQETPSKVGDPLYIVGYPQRSADRAQYGAPDAPGGQLRVSLGRVISMDAASIKQGVNPAELTSQTQSFYQQMVVSDADGAPGLSGGVALNAIGQIIGTYTAGYPQDGSATLNHVSYISNDLLLPAPVGH